MTFSANYDRIKVVEVQGTKISGTKIFVPYKDKNKNKNSMKFYAIFLLVFLGMTLVLGINYNDAQKFWRVSEKIDFLVDGYVFTKISSVIAVLRKEKPLALTPVDTQDNFYFDKETIDSLLEGRFYSKQPVVAPGTYTMTVTAYSSSVAQCDASPFITASGQRVRDGIVAANFLPLGTKIKIPALFGDKIFEVQDRMAQRHWGRVDVWFADYWKAARFGARELEVEIMH